MRIKNPSVIFVKCDNNTMVLQEINVYFWMYTIKYLGQLCAGFHSIYLKMV